MAQLSPAIRRTLRPVGPELDAAVTRHALGTLLRVAIVVFVAQRLWRLVAGEGDLERMLVVLLLAAAFALLMPHIAAWALARRHFHVARWLSLSPESRGWMNFQIAVARGDWQDATRASARLSRGPVFDVLAWNSMVNCLIASGRYHEAIRARRELRFELFDSRRLLPQSYGLALLNLAEALYNLGRWERARTLMGALRTAGMLTDPLNHTAGQAQLAWIEAHLGDGAAALQLLEGLHDDALPFNFRSEFHFTRAVAHLAAHDVSKARGALAAARSALIRPSSARNLLFLEARCAHAEGNLTEAARLCEQAANHPYRGQGGDGLLFWGDVCRQLGDSAGARRAWQLAIDRDGESESASRARERLA